MGKNEAYDLVAGGGNGFAIGAKRDRVRKIRDEDDGESDRTDLTPYLVAAVSRGVQRKKRMPRQRRSSVIVLPFSSLGSHVPISPTRVIDQTRLKFLFEKELQTSDVNSLRRMIIPKKAAEAYLPTLLEKEGLFITMDDLDGLHVWSFKFRYWPNNSSRMYVLENTGEFVNTHGLKQGDYIMLYQDHQNQNYVIRARKASSQDLYTDSAINAVSDYFPDDFEVNDSDQVVPVNAVDDTVMPFVYETMFSSDSDTSYVYETTIISNDSLFDFWSGPMTYNSRVGPIGSFESIENLSLEELLLSF
ncbi:hypothetical protein U1Q18_012620 [Sarracenia purpurea var. burkii]